jgi:hypothetical protein
VTLCDLEPLALACARHTAAGTGLSSVVRTAQMDWCDTTAAVGQPFDVVMACDVLYQVAAVAPLCALVPRLLKPCAPRPVCGTHTERPTSRMLHDMKVILRHVSRVVSALTIHSGR